jgi:hypothetical protein
MWKQIPIGHLNSLAVNLVPEAKSMLNSQPEMNAESMMNAIFWFVTPGGSSYNRCFGGTCRFHLRGEKNSELRTVLAVTSRLLAR